MALEKAFSEAFIHRLARPRVCSALPRGPFGLAARGCLAPLGSGFEAAPWSEHWVLGRQLRAFSLWHLLLLTEVESPVIRAAHVTPQDLVVAVEICRCAWPETAVGGRSWRRRLANFWRLAGGGFARQLKAFAEYRQDFESPPDFRIVPPERCGSSSPRGQPPLLFELLIATMQIARCGRAEAWGVSPAEAAWYRMEWLKQRGADVDFIAADDREEQERLAQLNPKLHAALLAGAAKALRKKPKGKEEQHG
jgi:hypothetical protein